MGKALETYRQKKMTSLPNVIYLFVIIFSISLSSGKKDSHWKTHKLISKYDWTLKTKQFDDPTFVYAICNDEHLPNSRSDCTIVLHENVHSNVRKPKKCTFTLENASNGIIRIENFGNDRAIFVWSNEIDKDDLLHWAFHTAVIRMSTCQIFDTGLIIPADSQYWEYGDVGWHTFFISLIAYEDTFDIVLQRAEACGDANDENHCVYTYNSDGKLIKGPVTQFLPEDESEFYQFKPSSRRSSDEGYIVIVVGKKRYISILKPKEDPKLLWELPILEGGLPLTVYAKNNEMILAGSCQVLSSKLFCVCMQSNEDGNSKREIEFSVKKPSEASSMIIHMHNIRGGGFFVIPLYNDNEKYFYSMTKVKADGKVIGKSIVIGSHSLACFPESVHTRMIERDDGKYCMTIACVEGDDQNKVLKTLMKCYNSSSLDSKTHAKGHVEL